MKLNKNVMDILIEQQGTVDAIITDPPYATTGVACANINSIGVELDVNYFDISKERLLKAIENQNDKK